jgi:hypothetical protein
LYKNLSSGQESNLQTSLDLMFNEVKQKIEQLNLLKSYKPAFKEQTNMLDTIKSNNKFWEEKRN